MRAVLTYLLQLSDTAAHWWLSAFNASCSCRNILHTITYLQYDLPSSGVSIRQVDSTVAVKLGKVHTSRVKWSNGIIQWTNCQLCGGVPRPCCVESASPSIISGRSLQVRVATEPFRSNTSPVRAWGLRAIRNSGRLSNEDLFPAHWIAMNELATTASRAAKQSIDHETEHRLPSF